MNFISDVNLSEIPIDTFIDSYKDELKYKIQFADQISYWAYYDLIEPIYTYADKFADHPVLVKNVIEINFNALTNMDYHDALKLTGDSIVRELSSNMDTIDQVLNRYIAKNSPFDHSFFMYTLSSTDIVKGLMNGFYHKMKSDSYFDSYAIIYEIMKLASFDVSNFSELREHLKRPVFIKDLHDIYLGAILRERDYLQLTQPLIAVIQPLTTEAIDDDL